MYPDPKSVSHALYDRALASLPGGNSRTTIFMKPYPIYAARGMGCRVWDVDGNRYIDCINNFTSLIHGHAHPALIEAATRQLALGSAFVAAQQQTGVAATVKHFPGLGAAAASQNTDERPVTLNVPLAQLRAIDELPFRSAFAAEIRITASCAKN